MDRDRGKIQKTHIPDDIMRNNFSFTFVGDNSSGRASADDAVVYVNPFGIQAFDCLAARVGYYQLSQYDIFALLNLDCPRRVDRAQAGNRSAFCI